ncbi:ATP phosphoribosyltransferase regulatory subunit, partial [Candidatus Woesearchaeota archaeon]|nr:ATP phosphoribosyltransferase regulatory subunit [Candidatus Woesearchaeota archaeon]
KEKGISNEQTNKLINAMNTKGNNKEKIIQLKKIITNEIGKQGLKEIEEILLYLPNKNIEFNPGLARGLGYYTGPIFEGFLRRNKITSSICGGGRYDQMIGKLLGTKNQYPATGISFGLDVITDAIKTQEKKTVTQLYIIPIGTTKGSLEIAQKLRQKGIKTDIDISSRGISKNLKYANSLNIPYVLFIGETELKQKKVKLRNMKTGKEELISIEKIKGEIKNE